MPKKAGPKRIDPDTFYPIVLTAVGTDMSILVCQRRWLRGPNVVGGIADAIISSEYFSFPVVIRLSPSIQVLTGFLNQDLSWTTSRPEAQGISEKCAKLALAEVWHAVKATLDLGTMSVHVGSKVADWVNNKNGVRMRNLVSALCWELWNNEGIDLPRRAVRMNENGYACTERQLERFMNEHGLPLRKIA